MPRKYTAQDFQSGDPDQQISINEGNAFLARLTRLGWTGTDLSADVRKDAAPSGSTIAAAEIIANGEAGIADAPIDLQCIIGGDTHNVRQLRERLEEENGLPTLRSYASFYATLKPGGTTPEAYLKVLELANVAAAAQDALQRQYDPQQVKGLKIAGTPPPVAS